MEAGITGKATFTVVDVEKEQDSLYYVTGYSAQGDTTYKLARHRLYVDGMAVEFDGEKLTFRAEGEEEWIMVEATKERLEIYTE